ncbi:anthranilate synthase component 2 [Catalinimonas alkaloidigena]|uniref:Anthranilate synthase component 2 n=1 Tax=Catalinimonas alkaloidigena TaxID=1075417 RepID=A0A1G9IXU2_9BACT|nr:aminodeoxychorismate/anthranilate synthase component II [Catalinimonas alkaloidigena]SDL29912.1 anthranilate synthase component 2 [Catalinimonas alkaloidigena]
MKILVFDNYDSFTYNLVHLIRELGYGAEMEVHRNDKIPLDAVAKFDKILLSPGPGIPSEAGLLLPLIDRFAPTKDILGVCLGHQAIGEAFGSKLINLSSVLHGIALPTHVTLSDELLFQGLPPRFQAGRYHSWAVDKNTMNGSLEITATDERGEVMALRHRQYKIRGVQFHPESVLTEGGKQMIDNWLKS